jgi:hypothetical protein
MRQRRRRHARARARRRARRALLGRRARHRPRARHRRHRRRQQPLQRGDLPLQPLGALVPARPRRKDGAGAPLERLGQPPRQLLRQRQRLALKDRLERGLLLDRKRHLPAERADATAVDDTTTAGCADSTSPEAADPALLLLLLRGDGGGERPDARAAGAARVLLDLGLQLGVFELEGLQLVLQGRGGILGGLFVGCEGCEGLGFKGLGVGAMVC